ncbi:hypothetical protein SynBIOSU31_02088 [Synechococcus sp. BIOS-U3-1]|uniref:hypothetical protein n=1 Tax=Synechococcus sp. BIOS-U3-1 TaxID=1400865 RepID=UPI0016480538|nr:hypothetical protein [Synechococcus sp. BIOS-U3-1]QNI58954.1 hypothetical protein SynBIOSU31_02088 [Synechococcus sp. BIOS-U3-1]
MTTYKRRKNGQYKPDWDRGNGWMQTKSEWQDIDKAVDKTVSLDELQELWCPASTSTITVNHPDIPGLSFDLEVGLKEYHPETKRKRKPTSFGITYRFNGFVYYLPFIPLPGTEKDKTHHNAWHSKFSWSQAVRTLTKEIITSYVEESQAMSLWGLASEQLGEVPEVPKTGEEEASAA